MILNMAIQTQMYPENLGLSLMGVNGVSQDWLFMANNQNNFHNFSNTNNNMGFNEFSCSNNHLQQQKQQQQHSIIAPKGDLRQQEQQDVLLQLQQQSCFVHPQNQQQISSYCENINNHDFVFSSSSRKNYTTVSSTPTTTGTDFQMPMELSLTLLDQLEKQRQEIDRFITLQNERLNLVLQEQWKHQLSTIVKKLEDKAMKLLIQKDDELGRITKRTIELEDIITKMEIENQDWQRLALSNEAMVVSLNKQLEKLQEQAYCVTLSSCSSNELEDAESCCNVDDNRVIFSNTSRKQETNVAGKGVILCKVCNARQVNTLLLPCRHLCCCKGCEPFVNACPVCKSAKMESIEALISWR